MPPPTPTLGQDASSLFTAALWEVDRTLMAQQCCLAVLQQGFLGGKKESSRAGGGGNILKSYPGRRITEATCALACRDLWAAAVFRSLRMLLNMFDLGRHRKSRSSKVRPSYPEHPTSSVSYNRPREWSCHVLVAVQNILEPHTVACLPYSSSFPTLGSGGDDSYGMSVAGR